MGREGDKEKGRKLPKENIIANRRKGESVGAMKAYRDIGVSEYRRKGE